VSLFVEFGRSWSDATAMIHEIRTLGYSTEYLANSRCYPETKTLSKRFEAQQEILNLIRKHYGRGNIPSTWIYAYAHYYMDRLVSRQTRKKNLLFILGMTNVAALKFLQYNNTLPLSEYKQWKDWYIEVLFHYHAS
jgi:hypothetical protein